MRLAFPGRPALLHTARVTWDHRLGFALSLRPDGQLEQTVMQAVTWHAYRQQYIGIEIGGSATELHPTRTPWHSTFMGWVPFAASRVGHAGATPTIRRQWRHLYRSCDRVRVGAGWRRSSRAIPLSLEPFQAQFSREFVISVNGRRIHTSGRHFLWHLRPGENRIEIATRNLLGAVGHPWRAVVIRCP